MPNPPKINKIIIINYNYVYNNFHNIIKLFIIHINNIIQIFILLYVQIF